MEKIFLWRRRCEHNREVSEILTKKAVKGGPRSAKLISIGAPDAAIVTKFNIQNNTKLPLPYFSYQGTPKAIEIKLMESEIKMY